MVSQGNASPRKSPRASGNQDKPHCFCIRATRAFLGLDLGYRWPSTGVKSLLPGKLRKKSEKGLPGALGPRVNTPPKKVKNESKTSRKPEKNLKNSHSRLFFEPFLTPGPRGPGNPFSDFFWSLPGKGLLTPVDGQRYPKTRSF